MLRRIVSKKEEGFTLIELMIVIAIIGILAAIAIPNFISYRNKSYCTGVSADAQAVKAAVGKYFSDPTKTNVDGKTNANLGATTSLSTGVCAQTAGSDIIKITMTPTGNGLKCGLGGTYIAYMGTSATGGWQP